MRIGHNSLLSMALTTPCCLLLVVDLEMEESSSVATAGGSEDHRQSTDSASLSIPSLELSDGNAGTGNSLDVDEALSSSYSAMGVGGRSPSTEVPSLREEEALGAAAGECFPLDTRAPLAMFRRALLFTCYTTCFVSRQS